MGDSYRIRTELGVNKTINVQLDQEFDFLEILSLKIQQSDIYTRSCSDYGVVVGRITANNGFGLPNARVSVFIPIQSIDESNPIITSIYPYKSPTDKNEDGYRYNLLPYEKSYSTHAATGTLPSRIDVLTGSTAIEIYDKYYKFTAKTNESGDYMIMGVPLGNQTIVMDVDLSDIGEFSLTPQDLIRTGRATEAQVAGNRFRTSSDLNSLPQIVSLTKSLEVSPLWGDPTICQIAVNRLDFDLRDDLNIDIQPTATFMGSLISTPDSYRLRGPRYFAGIRLSEGARPRDNMGNLCGLTSGPGQILAIRQTINQDKNGNPVLEQYQLEQAGNIIDGNGVWLTEMPMNLDYVITNEFGEKVLSNDPTIGIPTKGKYRFKIKWQQSASVNEQTKRAYFLVPNVREYGWRSSSSDPNVISNLSLTQKKELQGSYYFGLDWSGYTNTQAAINCEDTFYEFDFNRVYTVSGLIDEFKNGAKGRFIGIKEIDSQDCESTTNKFPVNEGFRNFDLLFFLFSVIFQVIQIIGIPLLIVYHFIAFLWNNFAVPLLALLILYFGYLSVQETLAAIAAGAGAGAFSFGMLLLIAPFAAKAILFAGLAYLLIKNFKAITSYVFSRFKLPMITYPTCQACECQSESTVPGGNQATDSTPSQGLLSQLSNFLLYTDSIINYRGTLNQAPIDNLSDFDQSYSLIQSAGISGNSDKPKNPKFFKLTASSPTTFPDKSQRYTIGLQLPPGERINVFNTRGKYFTGVNKIKVSFAADINLNYHYDNTLTVLSSLDLPAGTLLSFVNPTKSTDTNYKWSGQTSNGQVISGINGIIKTNQFLATVNYATTETTDSQVVYTIPSGNIGCVDSITINVVSSGTCEYTDCIGNLISKVVLVGTNILPDVNCINLDTLGGTSQYDVISYGNSCQRYIYPSDIEYYQVLTAITITTSVVNGKTVYTNPNFNGTDGFWGALNFPNTVAMFDNSGGWVRNFSETDVFPTSYLTDFTSQKVLILQRGVDPYSRDLTNKYGIGKILGYPNEDDVVITATTKMNIPIQKLSTSNGISVQNHSSQDNIFNKSYFYTTSPIGTTPGISFSSFTTPNVGYYSAVDSTNEGAYGNTISMGGGLTGVVSVTSNRYYSATTSNGFYDSSEDLSGGAIMRGQQTTSSSTSPPFPNDYYFSPSLLPIFSANPLSISSVNKTVMRTDRLPSSDYADDGGNWNGSVSLLQQNLGFAVYAINGGGGTFTSASFSTGADQVTADVAGQLGEEQLLSTLDNCNNMVGLQCYSGNSLSFGVKDGCSNTDEVENGCYVFLNKPLTDLQKDLTSFGEWGFRFRFFYGLCRGVLSQTFTNNWVNGSLFAYPIQVDVYYDKLNKPKTPEYPRELIYFDGITNNFYYRSSPYYSGATQPFIGRSTSAQIKPTNKKNLLYPVTIMNLGIKDSFYQEIIFDPSARAYVIKDLSPTSYQDTSDLVNLFVISRITDENFLSQIIPLGNNSLSQLFSRPQNRVDGDLVQLMSINSEFGVVGFSPEFYNVTNNPDDATLSDGTSKNPVVILGDLHNPTMGVFFSSTTTNLQSKDYLTPGVIDFRPSNNANAITYPYGIKSQIVPFYQWQLADATRIFGTEQNNWATNSSDIFGSPYQSLSRRTQPPNSYFIASNTAISDTYERAYIFKVSSDTVNTLYSTKQNGPNDYPSKFLVGAPFHFYFGLIKGESALDKFKTKYSVNE